jgi:hypothetical protein
MTDSSWSESRWFQGWWPATWWTDTTQWQSQGWIEPTEIAENREEAPPQPQPLTERGGLDLLDILQDDITGNSDKEKEDLVHAVSDSEKSTVSKESADRSVRKSKGLPDLRNKKDKNNTDEDTTSRRTIHHRT